jgi:maltooligosyltrehalose trehalohydrolase
MSTVSAPVSSLPPLGALPHDDGTTTFRVWAPAAESVAVAVAARGVRTELLPAGDGVFAGRTPAVPGDDYRLVIDRDQRLPDPCSRCQPAGLTGPSRVVDVPSLRRTARRPVALADLVLYELHVGTFSAAGTFEGAIPYLPGLRELGVTAIEVMPIATFAGRRGWGYDGVYAYAPHPAYGGPEGFARLVGAAHDAGLAVVLDVVYNHLGAGSEAIDAFGRYTTDRNETLWGEAIDFSQPGVREWAIQNAEMWIRDYGIDGLRLDAVHAIHDDRDPHILAELAARVKAIDPAALVMSEMAIGDLRPIEQWGHDAQWNDALHHAAHALITGERDGYYAHYGSVGALAREIARPGDGRLIVCAQNHDQVGNRALGDRLRGADLRLAAFCALLGTGTPLLFAGEEHDEAQPFQYFTDHIDARIAELTREGRRREFSEFTAFSGHEIPDPQNPETFHRSQLRRGGADPEHRAYYQDLLALRRELTGHAAEILEVDEDRRLLRLRRGGVVLIANFGETEQDGVPARGVAVRRA